MLEEFGYTHGDLAVQNIGIDNNNCLKLFDFGNATHKTDEAFKQALKKDHTGLATCLYFLLSGMEPLANAKDWSEVRRIQRELSEGRYKVVPEAEILREVIFAGWTGGAASQTFSETREVVEGIIGGGDDAALHLSAPKNHRAMEAVCVEWLDRVTLESRWLTEQQYRAKWQSLGYNIEEGIWGDG